MFARLLCIALSIALSIVKMTVLARAETPDAGRAISAVTLSFEPGGNDRALLVAGAKNGADLYIYRGVGAAQPPATPDFVKKEIAVNDPATRPSLRVKGNALVIRSGESFNQRRYEQTLTVVYRDKTYLVVGVTREDEGMFDNEFKRHSCDVNLLSGKGKENGKRVRVKERPIQLSEWSDQNLPESCAF